MKKVNEIMVSSPQSCAKTETLQKAAEIMSKSNIGSLPILDENKKVIGIITDRDITLNASQSKKPLSEIKVQDIISQRKVHTVQGEDNLETALKVMRENKVGRLPVVDKDQNLKGILSLNQIVRKTQGSTDEAELEYKGQENVMKTLHSLAERTPETVL